MNTEEAVQEPELSEFDKKQIADFKKMYVRFLIDLIIPDYEHDETL